MTVILAALKEEFHHEDYSAMTHYSGVGKVNAAMKATEVILSPYYRPECIINVGTVGALNPGMSGLYECGIFQDRDLPKEFNPEMLVTDDTKCICSTGDNFLENKDSINEEYPPDLVDMEAFAIATVCREYNVKFVCYKFVTDYVNQESSDDWKKNIGKGNSLFKEKLDGYFSNSV